MVDRVEFKLTGLESVLGKFSAVTYDVKKKGGRSALRKAANLLVNKVKEGAQRSDDPATPSHIAKNVALRWSGRRFKSTGDLMFRVGVLGGAGGRASSASLADLPGGDTRHWRFVEFGTETAPARPFMRPALSENVAELTDTFINEYDKALDRALARATKKMTGG